MQRWLPCSILKIPGAFRGQGSNTAAAAADPALAAVWDWLHNLGCLPQQYRGNSGLDVELRLWLNMNGEADNDIREELRRAAREAVLRAVVSACARDRVSC